MRLRILLLSTFLSLPVLSEAKVHDYITPMIEEYNQLEDPWAGSVQNLILKFEFVLSDKFNQYYYYSDGFEQKRQKLFKLNEYTEQLLRDPNAYSRTLREVTRINEFVPSEYKRLFGFDMDFDLYLWSSLAGTDGSAFINQNETSFALNFRIVSRYNKDALETVISHEYFHILQHKYFKISHHSKNNIAFKLMNEGWATYASSVIYPDKPDWRYISYFQKDDSQFREFESKRTEIIESLLKDLDSTNEEVRKKYFYGGKIKGAKWPPRSGYYIGYLLAKELAKTRTPIEVLQMSFSEFNSGIRELLHKIKK